jgi:uncharacterized protein
VTTQIALRVGKAGKLGRGVFAMRPFKRGELIERAPLMVIEGADAVFIGYYAKLGSYVFEHGDHSVVLGMGFISFLNHSYRPNAYYEMDYRNEGSVDVIALRNIKKGEQIRINYNGDPHDKTPINFKEWK